MCDLEDKISNSCGDDKDKAVGRDRDHDSVENDREKSDRIPGCGCREEDKAQ